VGERPDEPIYGEWSGAAQHERRQACEIQQVDLITGFTELRSVRGHALQFDCAETVREMHGKHRGKQGHGHWYADERHKSADQDGESTDELSQDRGPAGELSCGNVQGSQYADKMLGTPHQLGVAMRHEAKAHDQPQRNCCPALEPRDNHLSIV